MHCRWKVTESTNVWCTLFQMCAWWLNYMYSCLCFTREVFIFSWFVPLCVISDDSQWAIVCALLMLLINFLVQVTLWNNWSTLSNKKSSLKCFLHYSRLKSAVLNFRNIGLCYHTRRRRHGDRTRLKAKSRFQVNSCGSNRIKETKTICMILWQSILNHN